MIKNKMFFIFVVCFKYTFGFRRRSLSHFHLKTVNVRCWSVTYSSYGFSIITRFLFFTDFRVKDSSIILNGRAVDVIKLMILKSSIHITLLTLVSSLNRNRVFLVLSFLGNFISIRVLKLVFVDVDLLIIFLNYISSKVSCITIHYLPICVK